MIFKKSVYNPLKEIFNILKQETITILDVALIKEELEKGGIYPETEYEFNLMLSSLIDINPEKHVKQET